MYQVLMMQQSWGDAGFGYSEYWIIPPLWELVVGAWAVTYFPFQVTIQFRDFEEVQAGKKRTDTLIS